MPTVSIQKTEQKTESDIHTQDAPPQKDIYVELEKLDSLRKKGIITEAEFDAQKKKILERQ
jgi:membrane protease subunit (stomatin/prohibitin family)